RIVELRGVMLERNRRAIVTAIVENAELLHARFERREHHVERISDAVDAADFVAVISRDRQLTDLALREKHELDDDLGVEMEVVRVPLEGNIAKRIDRIDAVAGVEFAQM